jgi:hypothetical protein
VASRFPIILTFPDAQFLSFDEGQFRSVALAEISHLRITKGILERPQRCWTQFLAEGPTNFAEDGFSRVFAKCKVNCI